MLGELPEPDGTITEIESRDVIFLEGKFPRNGDIDDIDRFFEVAESQEGAPNPDQQMRATYCLVGVCLRVGVYH